MEILFQDVFERQDLFLRRMKEDYLAGGIVDMVYEPYFGWKFGGNGLFTEKEAHAMLDAVSDDLDRLYRKHPKSFSVTEECADSSPWAAYRGFGEDCYLVSYLEELDREVSALLLSGVLSGV